MIANGKALFDHIDSFLKKEGYKKNKDTWYKSTNDCICFFSIGKSAYGGYYEHVMGCFLKELLTTVTDYPLYYKNHLKYSLDLIADSELVKRAFDLENTEFTGEEREFILKELIEVYIIPFLQDVSTKDGIRNAVNKYDGLVNRIKVDARRFLSI
jgi:hypothetical protein